MIYLLTVVIALADLVLAGAVILEVLGISKIIKINT